MDDSRHRRADALIGELDREGSGRLTVFLGAAPGVGKTCAMLARAHELRRQGVDLVVALVETHGRGETAALTEGLELLPRRHIPHQGHVLEEMDLDGVLARRPQLALVDELAHRNAPGSRHERRWQDVAELLDAGIDVYTTLNVQHLESLNDLVQGITGIRVTETVPDALFDRLRDIVLVDLPPRELIERLRQGKVYVPEQAAQALQAFFSPTNLTALRELAMQTAADRVDSDLRESQVARGVPGITLRRRVLVAIDGRGRSEYLVRVGRRIAERRDAPWSVVHIQTGPVVDAPTQRELDRAFALARTLGAETQILHGPGIAEALLDHAAHEGVSSIVVGRTRERPLARLLNRTLTQRLLQRGAHYDLTIVNAPGARAQSRRRARSPGGETAVTEPFLVAAATALAIAIAAAAERWLGLEDLSMVFIVAVVLVAARTRMIAAVATAVLCFLAYNLFFIEPRFTLYIGARQGIVTVLLFLGAALVAGRLASRLRAQVLALRAANAHATVLQAFSRSLATATDLDGAVRAARRGLERAFDGDAWIVVDATPAGAPGSEALPDAVSVTDRDRAAADWTRRHRQTAGRHTDTLAGSDWWLLPIAADRDVLGVAALRLPSHAARPGVEQRRLAEAMIDDLAQAVLRARLAADLEQARIGAETERLRSALLSSVSHDLRSPLAAMIGAADSLASYGEKIGRSDRDALLETIRIEGERLDRYIQNLLDMTRLGHAGLTLRRDWIGVDELIGSATGRLQRYQPGVHFRIQIAPEAASLWVHPALVEQALFNVIENAVRFSPPDQAVTISAGLDDERRLRLEVGDRGPGIPEDERRRVFDMFYSVERGDRGRQGTGLGLAIAQGIVGAHGGSIEALPGTDGVGTRIRITLPRNQPPGPAGEPD